MLLKSTWPNLMMYFKSASVVEVSVRRCSAKDQTGFSLWQYRTC